MASTFKRRLKVRPKDDTATPLEGAAAAGSMLGLAGTKSWTGGITLTSSGLRDLDTILGGGGQPLGTCILIEEDRWTCSLASDIVRYWCAEAVSQNQNLVILTDDKEQSRDDGIEYVGAGGPFKAQVVDILCSLPLNLHWEKQQKRQQGENVNEPSGILETLEEDQEENEANEEGLKIAWQYRKNVQQQRLGIDGSKTVPTAASSDVYCHSYDMSRQLSTQTKLYRGSFLEELVRFTPARCCDAQTSWAGRSCGFRLFKRLLQQVEMALAEKPRRVVRLLLADREPETLSIALPLLLVQIRLRQLPVVVLVSMKPWKSSTASMASIANLHRCSDIVLQTEGFAARSIHPPPPEFRHLHGLLLVRKASTAVAPTAVGGGHYVDLTISKRPPVNIYGLKRDRRKLHIPLLHIPPEDHTGGGSVGGVGVRSGAGRPVSTAVATGGAGCGGGNHNSLLSF